MKTALYVRVSTDKQEVDNQLLQLREYCRKQNYEIVTEYTEIVSGAKTNRPQFDKMFKDAHQKAFELVLFWDISRFSRSGTLFTMQKLQELDNCNVKWHSFQEPYFSSIGHFKDVVISIMSTLARIEREKISERTKAGLARAKAEGRLAGRPKKDPSIYRKYCDVPKCRVKVRFDESFCKKHKALGKKYQEIGTAPQEKPIMIEEGSFGEVNK